MLKVFPVATRSDRNAFCGFTAKHYADSPNWVPMLKSFERELLNYTHHPFYDNAEIQTFLATRDGKVVGRIAAIIDHLHNKTFSEKRGMFGFFECIDDESVAAELFKAAFDWMRAKGMDCVRGPNSPSLNQQFAGCLINAFDKPPTFMMPYNKPYYAKLIESQGFVKAQDLLAFYCEKSMMGTMNPKLQLAVDEAHRRFPNMVVRPVNTRHIKKDLDAFVKLYNEGLRSVWGFVPMSDSEAASVASSLKLLIIPELTTVIELDGKAVAICFGMLDYNPIIKKIKGNLFPFGIFQLLWGKRSIKKVRIIGAYVSPEMQKWGLGIVLLSRMFPDILKRGITEAEFSYVMESNRPSRGTLERGGALLDKVYRMYDRSL